MGKLRVWTGSEWEDVKGEKGDPGATVPIKGVLGDPADLPTSGTIGDGYMVDGDIWVWSGTTWTNAGPFQGPAGQSHVRLASQYASHQAGIDAVYAEGGGVLAFDVTPPDGTSLVLRDGVYLEGLGMGATSWTAGTITGSGSLAALPALGATAAKDGRTVTFASTPSLAVGDVFVIENTTDGSYCADRAYYHAGEWCKVKAISGNTVTVTKPLYDTYTPGANIRTFKLNPIRTGISNMTIRFTPNVYGILLSLAEKPVLRNLELSHAGFALIGLDRCYDFLISNVYGFDPSTEGSTNYALMIGNSQRGDVTECNLEATRHGLTTGGFNYDACVPCRDITVTGGAINGFSSGGGTQGVGLHGNCEDIRFQGVAMPAGITLAGDRTQVIGCSIKANPSGLAVYFGEMVGATHDIIDCRIEATTNVASTTGLMGLSWDANQRRAGTFRLKGNVIDMGPYGFTAATGTYAVLFNTNAGYSAGPIDLVLQDNVFTTSQTVTTSHYAARIRSTSNVATYRSIYDINNITTGMRITQDAYTGAAPVYRSAPALVP